jgi:hypothetical protein
VKDFLGCQLKRDRGSRQLSVSCIPKIDALVEKFGLGDEARTVETPMGKDFSPTQQCFSVEKGLKEGVGTSLSPGHRYCELIGSLLCIANATRPDISQAVGVLSRFA